MAGRPAELHLQRVIAGRRARLLVNAGALLISAAGSVIIHAAATPSDASSGPARPLIAFCIFVLGVSLVMSALVADRFPRAARAGVAIARALQRYVFGLVGW
ncbi:hypothetical protein SETIT_4G263700v2 [Setaria italica]|uniref:Uncharacterized protein n=2 Tax=Setaria TaxID=4554 RepID=K3Y152_SETIT|nr:uncharacterized protein LOC105914264 [Setaria italica]RCV22986.1 hypothetical protein SETIT_4G263700v2 [Setaria italica]TKW23181.1 hypothetical protein SEVIR_4G276600v2 [Setaria viridis]